MIRSDGLLELDARDQAGVEHVRQQLRRIKRLGVAFSGGVDSAVLLALAVLERGHENVVALLGVSPSLAVIALRIGAMTARDVSIAKTHCFPQLRTRC